MSGEPLILATGSKARQALLRGAGVSFRAEAARIDEEAVKADLTAHRLDPKAMALALAQAKAVETSRSLDGLVIGADQTLDLGGQLVGKARDLGEARERLAALRGRRHQLHSATAAARDGELLWDDVRTATLTMRNFSDAFLEAYVERNAVAALASVGCYQLEGEGVQLFEKIDGDYFTILGLPLPPLLDFLRERGLLPS
ncbi:MAG: Maf family protein [Caulobacteraceae bacterium]|nr:Maf family protein [Caulobacteraceae bacterium]